MRGKALAAYDAGDSKVFYADFAKLMASVATDQAHRFSLRPHRPAAWPVFGLVENVQNKFAAGRCRDGMMAREAAWAKDSKAEKKISKIPLTVFPEPENLRRE